MSKYNILKDETYTESYQIESTGDDMRHGRVIFKSNIVKAIVALVLAVMRVGFAVAAPQYTITDLGTLPGFDGAASFGINNYGQVSGTAIRYGGADAAHGFLWTPTSANATTGYMIDLGSAESGFGGSMKINDYGQVIFNGGLPGVPGYVAFLWTPAVANATTGSRVPFVSTTFPSSAYGLNNLGQVVGSMYPGTSYVWTPDMRNGMTGAVNRTLAMGSNGPYYAPGYNNHSFPNAINDAGQVTGSAFFDPYGRIFIHNNGPISFPASNPYDFGTFSLAEVIGPVFQYNNQDGAGSGQAINAAGHIAGGRVFTNAQGQIASLPVYWDGGQFHSIGTASGYGAHGINNHDEVVGETVLSHNDGRSDGFLYRQGVVTELANLIDPTQGWRIDKAYAINDAHQIVGRGFLNGTDHAFLMTPITPTCASDVTSQVAVARGPFMHIPGKFKQTVTITNTGASAITGPISLVVNNLSANASLFNKTGTTSCATPPGKPFVDLPGGLAPGSSGMLLLVFDDPSSTPITYSAAPVLAGPNPR